MKKIKTKFKQGVASFYIVAISTLILLVVVMSFAAIIVSQIERTSNEDLSQSAYDSAIAGVEDAKLAYNNYRNCIALYGKDGSGDPTCAGTVRTVKSLIEEQSCDVVADILGRDNSGGQGVLVQESTNGGNNMQQYYTCTKLSTLLKDYQGELNSSQQTKVIKVKLEDGIPTGNITQVKINWYDGESSNNYQYTNFKNGNVVFPSVITEPQTATPPTISVAMVQTAESFSLSDFDTTIGTQTDRGMVYLVPTRTVNEAQSSVENNHIGTIDNVIKSEAMLKSNDKTSINLPYTVFCNPSVNSGYMCSATIELPSPVGGARNNDTFMFVVSLPYGKPSTSFSMEFLCGGGNCGHFDAEGNRIDGGTAYLDGVQVEIDSTGRANDIYRRVWTRLDAEADSSFLSIMGPLELTSGEKDALKKDITTQCEYNFNPTCSR